MVKRATILLFGLMLVGAGCQGAATPQTNTNTTPIVPPVTSTEEKKATIIEYKDGVFTPKTLTVSPGTTVTFKNVGTKAVWPASGHHPSHTLCPGFDSKKAIAAGEIYSFTFSEAKVCPFHNHMSATESGVITIK